MDKKLGALILSFSFCMAGFGMDKKELEQRYKGKYLVVLRNGLSVGICDEIPSFHGVPAKVTINDDHVDFKREGKSKMGRLMTGGKEDELLCNYFSPEPLQNGELLKIIRVRVNNEDLSLEIETVSPHSVTRGKGAHEHESHESAKAEFHFIYPAKNDYSGAVAIADKWIKPFETLEAASNFGATIGNTASGAFVKEVKLGMSPAEVESVMGLPISKADLGEKMLYKYKDMTVEFHDGKVTDVR
jgi:hypothetical protein